MYYQNYEDYMRSVLRYPRDTQDTYQMNYYEDERNSNYLESMYQDTKDMESLYPNIYKCINPYVADVCSRCNGSVTRDNLEDMVEEVYKKIENNKEIMINIVNDSAIISREAENRSVTQNNPNTSNSQNLQNTSNMSRINYSKNNVQNISNESLKRGIEDQENRESRETRQRRPNNPLLRDLIKILILNRLINNFPNRPNPPRPPRPPMPPRPPRPGYRGDFDDYLRF